MGFFSLLKQLLLLQAYRMNKLRLLLCKLVKLLLVLLHKRAVLLLKLRIFLPLLAFSRIRFVQASKQFGSTLVCRRHMTALMSQLLLKLSDFRGRCLQRLLLLPQLSLSKLKLLQALEPFLLKPRVRRSEGFLLL
ncbi:hypothetical protein D3C78_822320 [compost metagenome]